jgi:hypothetical protein
MIMRTSYGEISGFSAVGADELMLVNGGKGSSGGSSSSSSGSKSSSSSTTTKTSTITYQPPAPVTTTPKTVTYEASATASGAKGSVTLQKDNVSLTLGGAVSGSYTPPFTVEGKVDSFTVTVGFKK